VNPHERIVAVLRGEMPDRTPFTIKRPQPPQGEIERRLRNEGLALCIEELPFTTTRPHTEVLRRESCEGGGLCWQETYRTAAGEVSQSWVVEPGYGSRHITRHMIKGVRDYRVVEALVRDEVYTPAFERFRRAEQVLGGDGFVFCGWLGPTPLLKMLWELMGPQAFAEGQVEHRREFDALYETLLDKQREQVRIVADGPGLVAHFSENLTAEMIGGKRFREYVLPVYAEFSEVLKPKGKLLAAHCDGHLKALADELAGSALDVIEAFCPIPDGDMTVEEARRRWPDKILWINFPSPVHLDPPESIRACVREILKSAAPGQRFLFGITEDIPDGVWDVSLPAISAALQEYGALPISIA
jgi:hypothetical protein